MFLTLIFMYSPTKKSSGQDLVREKNSIMHPTVLYGMIGYGGRDLGLHSSSDTDHYNYWVIAVI